MENTKFSCVESELIDRELNKKSCNKMKYAIGGIKAEKLKNAIIGAIKSPRLATHKLWALAVTAITLLLWVYGVQLTTFQEETAGSAVMKYEPKSPFPPERVYNNNGYLMVYSNGGLNQMRAGICDMVVIARYLNVTFVVPELDNTSFWQDRSEFQDVFDTEYFIKSLRDRVRILKELPSEEKGKWKRGLAYYMPPRSWSNMSYYNNTILPYIRKYKVVHFVKTDTRLANNDLPEEVQKLRCRVMYKALRFSAPIEMMGEKIVRVLREKGPFLVLHLRYEMDMLAFSGCTEGCNDQEVKELTEMRYAYPWWKEKEIDSNKKRQAGLCPLTPEETALALRALEISPNIQIYIAAGDIYGGERRIAGLRAFYPNLVKKETLVPASDLEPFQNHSNQMAALDYLVSLASDIFVPTYGGNMAKVVEGHRRYLGYKVTINLDRLSIVNLIDQYRNGTLSWNEFSQAMKATHAEKMGSPTERLKIPGKPKVEDYFYSNPEECLPPLVPSSKTDPKSFYNIQSKG